MSAYDELFNPHYNPKLSFQRARRYPSKDPKPLKNAMDQFVKAFGMQTKMDEVEVAKAWESRFGEVVKRKTRLIRLYQGGKLLVRLDSGPLKEEFMMRKTEVVDLLNDELQDKLGRALVRELTIQ
jgi:hypothetical protein